MDGSAVAHGHADCGRTHEVVSTSTERTPCVCARAARVHTALLSSSTLQPPLRARPRAHPSRTRPSTCESIRRTSDRPREPARLPNKRPPPCRHGTSMWHLRVEPRAWHTHRPLRLLRKRWHAPHPHRALTRQRSTSSLSIFWGLGESPFSRCGGGRPVRILRSSRARVRSSSVSLPRLPAGALRGRSSTALSLCGRRNVPARRVAAS